MTKIKFAFYAVFLPILLFGCSSGGTKSRLGDIRYDEVKDQTYIIDDWYRQEGAAMSKLGFWGRIIKEGGRVKFQPVDRLINSFEIDRYPMRVSQGNHEEFKKLVVNVKVSRLGEPQYSLFPKQDVRILYLFQTELDQ